MPTVNKISPIDLLFIPKAMAIEALTIHCFEMHGKKEGTYYPFTNVIDQLERIRSFENHYRCSYYAIIPEIWTWYEQIISEERIKLCSVEEIYSDYASCISRVNIEPMKISHIVYSGTSKNPDWRIAGHDWVFKGFVYEVKGLYSDDEIKLLILEDFDKERRYFEKLNAKFNQTANTNTTYERPRIPESVRTEVWRRDGGKCARCGSREKLEYDHIVPISKGGSNTARNIELLCEKCNRSKSNNVV